MGKVSDSLSWLTSKSEFCVSINRQEMELKPLYKNECKLWWYSCNPSPRRLQQEDRGLKNNKTMSPMSTTPAENSDMEGF